MSAINQMVIAKMQVEQINRFKEGIQLKGADRLYNVIIRYDNVRLHVANLIKHAIQELSYEDLTNTPYSKIKKRASEYCIAVDTSMAETIKGLLTTRRFPLGREVQFL